ncbi:MAG: hypothetical protein QXR02_01620 [Acidilobaceae archaeon]
MVYKILITTSRRPSQRVRSFVKDLILVLPGAFRFTRGHSSYEDLAREAIHSGVTRVIIVSDMRGNPGIIRAYDVLVNPIGLKNIVSIIVSGVKLAREAGHSTSAPIGVNVLAVLSDESSIAEEFTEAFIKAFYARVYHSSLAENSIVASIIGLGRDTVKVIFTYRGNPIGPILRLRRPHVMIKDD